MSLFQVHEWWKCSRIDTEECGAGCLCVANIDNAADNSGIVFAIVTIMSFCCIIQSAV